MKYGDKKKIEYGDKKKLNIYCAVTNTWRWPVTC